MGDKKKVFLYISEIASYIGQNKWDFVSPFERLWKRCDLDGYKTILEKTRKNINESSLQIKILDQELALLKDDLDNKRITKRQWTSKVVKLDEQKSSILSQVEKLNERVDEIDLSQKQKLEKALGKENMEQIQSRNIETDNKRENVKQVIEKMQVSDKAKQNLKKETESFINKTHGTLKEESAIEIYEKKFGVKLNTSQEFYKKRLDINSESEYDWYMGGKVDGLYIDEVDPSKSYIIEVKNRTKGFFSTLRDYEKTQIQLYMYMLNIPVSKLVEKYKDNIRITLIYRDDEYINDILSYLDLFTRRFENDFLMDKQKKYDFVMYENDFKKVFLKKLYLNDIHNLVNTKIEMEYDDNCLIDDLD